MDSKKKRKRQKEQDVKTKCVFDMFHKEKVCDIQKTLEEYVDPVDKLRPNLKDVFDYNLTQTFAVMDKGEVKLRYTDTKAEYDWHPPGYEPPPPKIRKRKGRGRGPLDELLNEIWAKVVQRQQEKLYKRNALRKLEVDRLDFEAMRKTNELLMKAAGPDWYQELSNYQRFTVDNLAQCIVWDLRTKSIVCTTENLNNVGVKPNPKYIKYALKNCCASPAEFLLILYRLLNPKRDGKTYSIADRLILSSVVHLTMRDTLKELHIRIPSPPSKRKRVRRIWKEQKRGTCRSPYLDKFILRPRPLHRHWEKPDKEWPRNEYFNYLKELRSNTILLQADEEIPDLPDFEETIRNENDCYRCTLLDVELKLVSEWVKAQKQYNKLATTKCVKALHKASVFHSCLKDFIARSSTVSEYTDDDSTETYYKCESLNPTMCKSDESLISDDSFVTDDDEPIMCAKYEVEGNCKKKNMCKSQECKEDLFDELEKPLKIISETKSKPICTCLDKVEKAQDYLNSPEKTFIITGSSIGPDGKVCYILGGVKPKDTAECKEQEERPIVEMPHIPDDCIKYEVSGVHSTPEGNVYIMTGTSPNPKCKFMNIYKKFIEKHVFCMFLYNQFMEKIKLAKQEYIETSSDHGDGKNAREKKCVLFPVSCNTFEDEEKCMLTQIFNDDEKCVLVRSCSSEMQGKASKEDLSLGLERYIILHRFPRNVAKQFKLLKKALNKLAEDGFPLALLPEVYKLPHFRLWLKMRAKKYWNQKQKRTMLVDSLRLYNHIDRFKLTAQIVKADFPEDPEKENWNYRPVILKENKCAAKRFFGRVNEVSMDYARKLFPITNTYEFPTTSFRDVYFSYMPSKEAEILAYKIWRKFEFRNHVHASVNCID